MRVPTQPLAVPDIELDLPSPAGPDLMHLARSAQITHRLAAIGREACKVLDLSGTAAERLVALHDKAYIADEARYEAERVARFTNFQNEVEELLGDALYRRYQEFFSRYFERVLLEPHPSSKRRYSSLDRPLSEAR
jgi:hypothetical protein